MQKRLSVALAATVLVCLLAVSAQAAKTISFSVPPWPGVKVKSEVVIQILEAIGYKGVQRELSPPITYTSMAAGDLDVCLAAWVPQQNPMLDPKIAEGSIEIAATNLDEASISLCVPEFVYEQGVHSLADLDKHAGKFESTIYNIEMGTGMYQAVEEMIANDVAGLGDWKHVGSATPIMLSNAKGKAQDGEWVVFGCWRPHWMTLELDMRFLEGVPGSEKLVSDSKVHTVVRRGFKDDFPNVHKFLSQVKVTSEMQSRWIYGYSFEKIPATKVARKWIGENLDTVADWLEGIHTADGKPGMDAVRAKFAN